MFFEIVSLTNSIFNVTLNIVNR